jgi:hypothetical protein
MIGADRRNITVVVEEQSTIGAGDRILSLVIGLIGIASLPRSAFLYIGASLMSGYLIYRAVTGDCPVGRSLQEPIRNFMHSVQNNGDRQVERFPSLHSEKDNVDETSADSFPASDPPASW